MSWWCDHTMNWTSVLRRPGWRSNLIKALISTPYESSTSPRLDQQLDQLYDYAEVRPEPEAKHASSTASGHSIKPTERT